MIRQQGNLMKRAERSGRRRSAGVDFVFEFGITLFTPRPQSQFADVSDADLGDLDGRIAELNSQVQTVTQSCKKLDAALKELQSSLTTEEMTKEVEELKQECCACRERLKGIKSADNHVTPEEKEKVYKERNAYLKEWKKRKRLASDMIDSILEGYPKSKKQFLEEVGIETDEDCKVNMPSV
uniref:PSMC3 interacting protein n=1 Tax=Scleropages formosus TaxID=113540 RepID=A0A8C9TNH7_SCLFO